MITLLLAPYSALCLIYVGATVFSLNLISSKFYKSKSSIYSLNCYSVSSKVRMLPLSSK